MPASDIVHFFPDNATITFSSLLRQDEGVYKCLVVETGNLTTNPLVAGEDGTPILSFGYLMQVICEYSRVRKLNALVTPFTVISWPEAGTCQALFNREVPGTQPGLQEVGAPGRELVQQLTLRKIRFYRLNKQHFCLQMTDLR